MKKKEQLGITRKRHYVSYSATDRYELAVGGEVELDDEAGNVFAVADAVEGGAECQVVEIYSTLHRAHGQESVIRTESANTPRTEVGHKKIKRTRK